MLKFVKDLVYRILKKILYGRQASEKEFEEYLRKKGVRIGKNLKLYSPETLTIDLQNPHLLKIGDNVKITKGCTILTHDYSYSVLAGVYGDVISGFEKVSIGSNVFVGVDSVILKGTTIEDNVIIGAHSVVSGKCLANSVYAGNPARRIMSLEEYYKRRLSKHDENVKTYVEEYVNCFKKYPSETEAYEYFMLYQPRDKEKSIVVDEFIKGMGCEDKVLEYFMHTNNKYNGLEDMINQILKK